MKKRLLLPVAIIVIATSMYFISCVPDQPDKPADLVIRAHWDPMNVSPIKGSVDCYDPGDDCPKEANPCPQTTAQREMRDSFYVAYYNNNTDRDLLPFLNRHPWAEIFPYADLTAPIITRVQNGEYGITLAEDTSLIITTTPTGEQFTDEQIVAAYKTMPCR